MLYITYSYKEDKWGLREKYNISWSNITIYDQATRRRMLTASQSASTRDDHIYSTIVGKETIGGLGGQEGGLVLRPCLTFKVNY